MDNPINEIKKLMATTNASLQVMGATTKALSEDLKRMTNRVDTMDEAITSLQGTFASIEVHLVRLFEMEAETEAWKAKTERRLEALEKRPPAA